MKKILQSLIVLFLIPYLGNAQCTLLNPTTCQCLDQTTSNCDLLPDVTVSRAPLLINGSSGYTEYPQVCNPPCSGNDGRIRISVATPNIGRGPMETRGTPTYVCGTDTFVAANVASIPATCPTTGLPPKQLIVQRIYHKNGGVMTFTDKPAGTMTYHASHGHQHVDDWGVYTLRTATADPNPLNWPIVGTGAKLSFCLLDIGSCAGYNGYCIDSNNITITGTATLANYGLGGGNYGCSNVVQGISAGYLDIYSQGLDGMWIVVPPGTCNGNYWIVVEIDPHHFFSEENKLNNVVAVPITLAQQGGSVPLITASGPLSFCTGGSVTLTSSAGSNYLWSNGATTQSINVTQAGSYAVTINSGTTCPATSNASVVSVSSLNVSASATPSSLCPGQNVQLNASVSGNGTTLVPVSFSNNSVVSIPDNSTVGASTSVTVSGITPATLATNTIAKVVINITHTYDADLTISLISPSGNNINLSNSRGGSGDNFVNTEFNMSALTAIALGAAPFTGAFIPDGAFSALTANANGTWTLKVVDHAGSDVGTLNNWTLTLNNTVPSTYSYSWTSSPPGFTSGIQNPVVNPGANTVYTVLATESGTGCTGSQNANVTVGSSIHVTTNSPSPICAGDSTVLNANGAGTYIWSPSAGLNSTTGSSVVAKPTATTTYLVIGNSGGCIDSAYINVVVKKRPQLTVSQAQVICNSQSVSLNASGADTYSWSPAAGLNTTSGPVVNASPTSTVTYVVTGTSLTSGCSSSSGILITVNNIPSSPATVAGNSHNCLPLINEAYSVVAVSGATNYLWSAPAGVTLTGQGSVSASASATTAVNGNICVTASNTCGTSASTCIPFTTQTSAPSTPSSINGALRACPGETINYFVGAVARASFYNWSLPVGVVLNSGGGTNSIIVTITNAFQGGTITVSAGNGCGVSGLRTRNVSLNTPGTPGTMSGAAAGVCNSTQTYAVTAVAGMTYIWTVPTGATIIGPSNGNSINVSFASNFISGSITTRASNLCGVSGIRSKNVRATTAQPTAIFGATNVCTGQTNVSYSISALYGAITYLWTVPNGCVISSGQGTNVISITMSTNVINGSVTVRGVNNCGQGSSRSLAVSVNACPKLAGNETEIKDLAVFPNPAKEYIQIMFQSQDNATGKIKIMDIIGKERYNQQINIEKGRNSYLIDIRKYPAGVYLVSLTEGENTFTKKLIVN